MPRHTLWRGIRQAWQLPERVLNVSPLAGTRAPQTLLVNVSKLITAYYTQKPDAAIAEQRVAFGTSGHRGSAFETSFNEWHVLAISQAVCEYRKRANTNGPLFLGIDTHALSEPACASALEVLAAHGVDVMLARHDEYTPTPAVSHAILTYNRGRTSGIADGIVITPSHNPPESGGFKYNPPHGGPADVEITQWIEAKANEYLTNNLRGVARLPYRDALRAPTTHRHDYLKAYVEDLDSVLDMDVIRGSQLRLGVDPLGGAGVHYWDAIAERYRLHLTIINSAVDPTFRFISLDWDGRIRMDPSSSYAMQSLIAMKNGFDVAFACDTDHDRHGIVTPGAGLLPPNHYLAVCIQYLFGHRPQWPTTAAVGKTVVSSQIIDRIAAHLKRKLYEVPVGFKWFVAGLQTGSLGFGGEESAGASFLRRDGTTWTTDKDGIVMALLAAEITAQSRRDPGELYRELTQQFGAPAFLRIDAPASREQKAMLAALTPQQISTAELAGEPIQNVLVAAPGNNAPIGGVKVMTEHAWFAARPSGTENLYKIYGESFLGDAHLKQVVEQAQRIVDQALTNVSSVGGV